MKKVFVFLFFLSNLIFVMDGAASPLTLSVAASEENPTDITITQSSGNLVQAVSDDQPNGNDRFDLGVDTSRTYNFDFIPTHLQFVTVASATNTYVFDTDVLGHSFSAFLMADTYTITVTNGQSNISGDGGYTMTISTPIPAAAWLFGSVFLAMVGLSKRKSYSIGSFA